MANKINDTNNTWHKVKTGGHTTHHHPFAHAFLYIPIVLTALLLLVSCGTKQAVAPLTSIPTEGQYVPEHSPDVFLVMYDAEIGKTPLLKAIKAYKCEIVYDYGIINGMALKKPKNHTLEETMAYFRKVKGVLNVEYDHIYRLTDPVKPRLEMR